MIYAAVAPKIGGHGRGQICGGSLLEARGTVQQEQGRLGREIGAAIMVHIAGGQQRRAGGELRNVHRLVVAGESIAVQDAGAILVRNHEVEAGSVGLQIEVSGAEGLAFDEGKAGSLVAEAGLAVVAEEFRVVTQQEKVEIVIVVVVEPGGGAESAGGQVGLLLELAVDVAIERGAVCGEDGEIGEAVVIEIAGDDRDYVAQAFEAAIGHGRGGIAEDRDARGRPGDQAGLRTAIEAQGNRSRVTFGEALGAVDGGCRRRGGQGVDRVVDFGVPAPGHVFGNRGAFLGLLQLLEGGQLLGGFRLTLHLAVEAVELEVRRGEQRVEVAGDFELLQRRIHFALCLEDGAHLVMGDRLVGDQARHAFELLEGGVEIALVFIGDAEVKPGVRQFGVEFLRF